MDSRNLPKLTEEERNFNTKLIACNIGLIEKALEEIELMRSINFVAAYRLKQI